MKEGLCQLSDRNFYRLHEENVTHVHNETIKNQVVNMLNSKEISTICTYYQKFTKILFPLQDDQ